MCLVLPVIVFDAPGTTVGAFPMFNCHGRWRDAR